MGKVWCVAWIDKTQNPWRTMWCATKRGKRPDERAVGDETRCDHVVMFRGDDARRMPTCAECREAVRRSEETRRRKLVREALALGAADMRRARGK
jgi:hypothetical protein